MRGALLLAVLTPFGVLAACGGGGEETAATPTVAVAPSPPPAGEIFPDLSDLGLEQAPVNTLAGPAGFAIAFAVYEKGETAARVEVRTYPSPGAARDDFRNQVLGWKSPPSGAVFTLDPKNVDAPPLEGPEEAQAYVSTRADARGRQIWTDIFRQGSVIVVAHTLTSDSSEATAIREAIASRILAALR